MNFLARIVNRIKTDLSMQGLYKILLIFAIVWLFQATSNIWQSIFGMIWSTCKPFVYGFVIAYVLREPIKFCASHKISPKIAVPIVYVLLIGLLVLLVASVVPMLVSRAGDFINSIIGGLNWLYDHISASIGESSNQLITDSLSTVIATLSDFRKLIPDLSKTIPDIVNQAIGVFTTALLSIIISIFMSFSWDSIKATMFKGARKVSRSFYECFVQINDEIGDYLKSQIVLMLIRFVEYALFYLLVGHSEWMILGILTAISILIPYIGPVAVNGLAIITGLTLPLPNLIAMIVVICVLSQVDEYVIAPIVRSRTTNITPLWSLFSIFLGSTLLGIPGIVIAIPVFLMVRVVIRKYTEENEAPETEFQKETDE